MAGLKAEQLEFYGALYIGCMLMEDGIKVIKYNIRLGDPETQILLPQLTSDFYQAIIDLLACKNSKLTWQKKDYYLGVVVAASGYPGNPQQGISLPQLPTNVFYAGVENRNEELLSSGGRIFTIYDHAPTLKRAQKRVNAQLAELDLADFYYREDIGFRDI
ncbi:phosphoribosylglycinamide synthetase C domain-containing protein [Ligilactobacillus acidipiscis]|uniref:phosphoribosylglycinamide synthetase C domain-containing protein n=1 Tax=Ligilactobacillus acidipiscis TaxID=89059 RepID=UPI0023F84629|nr:phosphoribosylglycinamide synthetase C domain-containing protein [Ligilactobacillus acidipiscis]WEV58199.1 hypothetical protein OZX66_12315 [Ligilactobacillus acidipiscis]